MDSEFNYRAHADKKKGSNIFVIFIIINVVLGLFATFSRNYIGVSLEYDGSFDIYGVESTFWGLKKEYYEVKYDNDEGAWCIRSKNGEWSIMMFEDEDNYYDHYDY